MLVLEADLSKASGTNPTFAKEMPDRFINCGVAEADMMCIAAGLAVEGKIPFCASFTPFASRRVYDQVTISVAYANTNVKIVGTAPGITAGPNGGTHMCFQDLAIMRAMPNMIVLSPCDCYELRECLLWMAKHEGPVYMQLIRMKQPKVFDAGYKFDPDKAVQLRSGTDVTLVSTGYMTPFAMQAADELAARGVSVDLLHYPCVKPFDAKSVIASAKKTGRRGDGREPEHHRRARRSGLRGAFGVPADAGEAAWRPGQVRRSCDRGLPVQQARVRARAHQGSLHQDGHASGGGRREVIVPRASIRETSALRRAQDADFATQH